MRVSLSIWAAILLTLMTAVVGCDPGAKAPAPPSSIAGGDPTASTDAGENNEPAPPPIDPAIIEYRQTALIPVAMRAVRAVAVGPADRIYVGGDQAIHVFDSTGKKQQQIALDDQPRCLAVGNKEHAVPGRIFVGMKQRVEVVNPADTKTEKWEPLNNAWVTSIAVADQDVFVADVGNRIVWHFDTGGKLLGRIGGPDPARKIPGFAITSPYFDLAVGPDGLLRVVNPRLLRIEAYTFSGDLEAFWGNGSPAVDGFFGCCNPAHFAILPDGRFVTAEKGVHRVKIYSPQGKFVCVVAGPEQVSGAIADVAVDSAGRVLILDYAAKSVRIFEHKTAAAGGKP